MTGRTRMRISTIPTLDALRPAWDEDIDFPWHRDAFRETEHPRGGKGTSKGGQFVSKGETGAATSRTGVELEQKKEGEAREKEGKARGKEGKGVERRGGYDQARLTTYSLNIPQPTKYNLASGGKMVGYAKEAMQAGDDPKEAAEKIKGVAAEYKHHNVARHANAVLRHMEEAYGLPSGSLGKALPRKVDPPPPLPPPEPPKAKTEPPKAKAEPPPTPPQPAKVVERPKPVDTPGGLIITSILDNKRLTNEEKLARVKEALWVNNVETREYRDAAIAYLESLPPEPPAKIDHPKSMAEVMAHRTDWSEKELDWHRAAWSNATPEFLSVLQNTKRLGAVVVRKGTHAHYTSGIHTISMDPGDDHVVWRHEYGHAVDWENQYGIPRSFGADDYRKQEAKGLLDRMVLSQMGRAGHGDESAFEKHGLSRDDVMLHAGQSPDALMDVLSGKSVKGITSLVRRNGSVMEGAMLNDFLGAMTNNKIGWGHSNDYYRKNPAKHCSEMFANYVSLTQGPSGKVYRAIMHSVAPQSCAYFDRILRERAARGSARGL